MHNGGGPDTASRRAFRTESQKEIPGPLEPRGSVTRYDTVALGNQPPSYDRAAVLGRLHEPHEDEDIPFFWFHSLGEAFHWTMRWFIPGLGMFSEAYYIFSIGNVKPLLQYEFPRCWKTYAFPRCWGRYQLCQKELVQSVDYMQIIGIIFGMCLLGIVGDRIGRKWGSVTTASIMLLGAIMLTAVNGKSEKGFTIMYLISQFVFGFGVGGEYPMAAGSAAERAEAGGKELAKKRGREVVLTFSMQGVGNFVNVAVLCVLIPIYGITVPNRRDRAFPYRTQGLSGVWRTAFGLGGIPILFMLFWRIFRLRESPVWLANRDAARKSGNAKQERKQNVSMLFSMYWHRLLATGGSWFLWDFSFYGNKVFQSSFIQILSPGASILTTLLWTLLNSGIALLGYWVSALFIDNPSWGRLRTQIYGFAAVGILFFVCAIWYHPLTTPGGIHVFQFVYFFSSFWSQFGPNTTTFLLAGELYPTNVRTTAHGLSAGTAKMGALWAAVWFNYLPNRTKFWTTAALNIGGLLLTVLFMPDPLRVSLAEVDRRFRYALEGRTYHGEAVNRRNLSYFEIFKGDSKPYDPAADEEDLYQDGVEQARLKGGKGSPGDSPQGGAAAGPQGEHKQPLVQDFGGRKGAAEAV